MEHSKPSKDRTRTGRGPRGGVARHRSRFVAAAILLALLAASCGGSDDDGQGDAASSSDMSTTSTTAPLPVEVTYSFGGPEYPFFPDQVTEGWLAHGTSGYTGDWVATATYASVNQSVASGAAGLSLGVLFGEVAGCGSGSFVLVDAFRLGTPTAGWLIVPGFGTADLATLDGAGTWETLEGSPETASKGAIRGQVACDGSDVSAPETGPFFGTTGPGAVTVDTDSVAAPPTIVWTQDLTQPEGGAAETIAISDGTLTLRLDGTWTGEATAKLASATSPVGEGGYVHGYVMRFEGTVEGCGAGSLVMVVLDRVDAESVPAVRSWEIVPDLGTGDLVGATGFGAGSATGDTGSFTGSMSCPA